MNERMVEIGSERSAIREIFDYGCARKAEIGADKVFDFSLGNPSVPAPPAVTESLERLVRETPAAELHAYSPSAGIPAAREAVASSLNRRFGTDYAADNVFMTAGAAASMCCTLHALLNPGDEVIVVAPYFPEYRVWIEGCGATCVEAPAKEMTFQLSVGSVMKAISPKTAAIIVDSPNNPTGAVYTRDTLTRLSNVLREVNAKRERPIVLISDEPYRELTFGAEVPWIPDIYDHTVVCYSYSKSLSLPGERIGWILVPDSVRDSDRLRAAIAGAARVLGFVCAPVLFQRVLIDCVDEPADLESYRRNRFALTGILGEAGYTFHNPDGAFYLWLKALEPDAQAFCERARAHELLPVASDSFGMKGWVRVSFCVSPETIRDSAPAWRALAREYR